MTQRPEERAGPPPGPEGEAGAGKGRGERPRGPRVPRLVAPILLERPDVIPAVPAVPALSPPGEGGDGVPEAAAGAVAVEGEVIARGALPRRARPADGDGADDGVERLADALPLADLPILDAMIGALAIIRGGGMPFGAVPQRLPAQNAAPAPAGRRGRAAGAATVPATAPVVGAALDADDGRWPAGPIVGTDMIARAELEALVEALLTDPEVMGHPTAPGLTRSRLREAGRRAGLAPARLGRHAAHLLLWFAQAGVTVPASDRWRGEWDGPRPLATDEKREIRQRLRRVEPPSKDEVRDALAQGLDQSAL